MRGDAAGSAQPSRRRRRAMGKDHDLVAAAKNGNLSVVEKILVQKAKRTGPLARSETGG